jgi:bifunctional non-homologous end joining protein LigD
MAKLIKRPAAGFVIPARPVLASKPLSGADWVHEIKHDGYRIIVRPNGPAVRLYSRNARTRPLHAIADRAKRIKAKSFTIDGEAVVLGPDGLSRFEELSRREAADTAILYAFDLIERDGEDMRNRLFLDRTFRRRSMGRIGPVGAASGSRPAIPPPCSGSGARIGIDEPQAAPAPDSPVDSATLCRVLDNRGRTSRLSFTIA